MNVSPSPGTVEKEDSRLAKRDYSVFRKAFRDSSEFKLIGIQQLSIYSFTITYES